MLLVIAGNILNQPLVDLANRPVVGHIIAAGDYVIESAFRDTQVRNKVIRCFCNRLTVKNVRVTVDTPDCLLSHKMNQLGAIQCPFPADVLNQTASIKQVAVIFHPGLHFPSQTTA